STFIPAWRVPARLLAAWGDTISLTDAEERIVQCLQIVAPIKRLTLVEHPQRPGSRMAIVRLAGQEAPPPLASLGEAMGRVFQIALAMELARGKGVLLIDEVENGIHYTALPTLWRFIFEASRSYGVQVFATTHSWDCVEGFQKAAGDDPQAQGMLIRLEKK